MKTEYWHWTFRDPQTGLRFRTSNRMTERDALRLLPRPERVPGSLVIADAYDDHGDDFEDTSARAYLHEEPRKFG